MIDMKCISTAFAEGKIEKKFFWQLIRERLFSLEECRQLLANNDFCEKIEINKNGIILKSENIRFYFDFSQTFSRAEAVLSMYGDYEKEDVDFIIDNLADDGTVFDVGGNVGVFSLYIANSKTKSRIYSFEPLPSTYKKMLDNLALNSELQKRIISINKGMSAQGGQMFFYLPVANEAASMRPINDEFYMREINEDGTLSNKIQMDKVLCNIDTVDNFVKENNVSRIDLLKCDVEGAEKDVLLGAKETLIKHKPMVYCEMLRKHAARFDYHPNEIIRYMEILGYKCYTFRNHELVYFPEMTDQTMETNFFFLHEFNHKDVLIKMN